MIMGLEDMIARLTWWFENVVININLSTFLICKINSSIINTIFSITYILCFCKIILKDYYI